MSGLSFVDFSFYAVTIFIRHCWGQKKHVSEFFNQNFAEFIIKQIYLNKLVHKLNFWRFHLKQSKFLASLEKQYM